MARHDRRLCAQPRRHRAVSRRADGDPATGRSRSSTRPPRIAVCFTPHKDELQPEGMAARSRRRRPARQGGRQGERIAMPREMRTMREGQDAQRLRGAARRGGRGPPLPDLLTKSFQEGQARGRREDRLRDLGRGPQARRARPRGGRRHVRDIDVILTPPAPRRGAARAGADRRRDLQPAVDLSLDALRDLALHAGPAGLPVGIQLVGRQHEDATLLDIAGWVKGALQ